jgi:hypothetical protein
MSTIALERYTAHERAVGSVAQEDDDLLEAAHVDMVADAERTCPSWCVVNHAKEIRESLPQEDYAHSSYSITVPCPDGGEIYVQIRQWVSALTGPRHEPKIHLAGDAESDHSLASAALLATAIADAAGRLAAIEGMRTEQ